MNAIPIIARLPGETEDEFEFRIAEKTIQEAPNAKALFEAARSHPEGSWLRFIFREAAELFAMKVTRAWVLSELAKFDPRNPQTDEPSEQEGT